MKLSKRNIYTLSSAYYNGIISEKILKMICKEHNYRCDIDKAGGVMIIPKVGEKYKQGTLNRIGGNSQNVKH